MKRLAAITNTGVPWGVEHASSKPQGARGLLLLMVKSLDRDDSETYWECFDAFVKIHAKAIEESK